MRRARRMARRRGTMQAQDPRDERVVIQRARERNAARRATAQRTAAARRAAAARGARTGIAGVIIGALEPGMLGSGELTPQQRDEVAREVAEREARRQAQIEGLQVEIPPNKYGFPQRRLPGGEASVERRAAAPYPLPFPKVSLPPVPAAPNPIGPYTPPSRLQRVLRKVQTVTSNPFARLATLGLGVLSSSRSRSSQTVPAVSLLPPGLVTPEPLTPFNTGSVPFVAGQPTYSVPQRPSGSATQRCDCKPKKRGPKRRCLERGQVQWRSGRYKGKPAGSRCIRWE